VSLWRSWLPAEALDEAAGVVRARRLDNKIRFGIQDALDVRKWREGRIGVIYSSALGLGDSISAGLAGICLSELNGADRETIGDIQTLLGGEDVNLSSLTQTQLAMLSNVNDPVVLSRIMRPFGQSVGGRNELEFRPIMMRIFELIARSPLSYESLERFRCSAGSLAHVAQLRSRYEVELLVALRTALEPRWLPALLLGNDPRSSHLQTEEEANRERAAQLWHNVLRSTSAAPLLRAAVRLLPPIYLEQITPMIREINGATFEAFDAETAALVAIVGDKTHDGEVRKLGLDALVNGLMKYPSWHLAKMPLETLGSLVDMLVNPVEFTDYRQAILKVAKKQLRDFERSFSQRSFEAIKGGRTPRNVELTGVLGILEFRVQCARLGIVDGGRIIGQLKEGFLDFNTLPSREFYRIVLLFVRFAREQERPDWVYEVFRAYDKLSSSASKSVASRRRRSRRNEDLSLLQMIASERSHLSATEADDMAWVEQSVDLSIEV
jgi:hypothetical protein